MIKNCGLDGEKITIQDVTERFFKRSTKEHVKEAQKICG